MKNRLHFLDGMRGWAALMVVIWHYFVVIFPLSAAPILQQIPFINGQLAVRIFFVISGFALSIAMVERPDFWRLVRMGTSRYVRLVIPIAAICTLIHLTLVAQLVAKPFPSHLATHLTFEPTFAHLLRFSFFDVFFRFTHDGAYLLPLWTMQFEFFGSFLVFGVLATVQYSRYRLWIYGALTLLGLGIASFYTLFIAGVLLANLLHVFERHASYRHLTLAAYGSLAAGFALSCLPMESPLSLKLLGTILLVASLVALPQTRRWFSTRVSHFLGAISFPIYLVHVPLIYVLSLRLDRAWVEIGVVHPWHALLTGVIGVGLSILGAMLFLPVERLSIRASHRFGKQVVGVLHPLAKRITRASA